MRARYQAWLLFGTGLLLVLGVMGFLTATVVELDFERRDMERRTAFEERVRLAMWRMDALVAPLVGTESARPYFWYGAFHPAGRAFTRMFGRVEPGEVLFPSPLMASAPRHVRVYFQFGPGGELTSPQVPTGNMRDIAESGYLTHEQVEAAAAKLEEFGGRVRGHELLALLPEEAPARLGAPAVASAHEPSGGDPVAAGVRETQRKLSVLEWEARNAALQQASSPGAALLNASPESVSIGPVHPVWVGDVLVLARRVELRSTTYVQGCVLDWDVIRHMLLSQIEGLLPDSTLVPSAALEFSADRTLASLPVRLEPGRPLQGLVAAPFSPLGALQLSLIIGWFCVLAAGGAVAFVLHRTMALSERRAAFVSAVTHELRTPLTTFRMYTEMLEGGMVPPSETGRYLSTIRAEADRLGHLVQNVLDYARLERGRGAARVEELQAGEMLGSMLPRLEARCREAEMEVVLDVPAQAGAAVVRVDPAGVERILLNLVDNSCKYAQGGEPRRIEIAAGLRGKRLTITVRDHGPGIPANALRRLFLPFSKNAGDAAGGAPGVGLGLALSKRLADRMGGTLELDRGVRPGACFRLSFPRV